MAKYKRLLNEKSGTGFRKPGVITQWFMSKVLPSLTRYTLPQLRRMKVEQGSDIHLGSASKQSDDISITTIEYPYSILNAQQRAWAGLPIDGKKVTFFDLIPPRKEEYYNNKFKAIQQEIKQLMARANRGDFKGEIGGIDHFQLAISEILSKQLAFTEGVGDRQDMKRIILPVMISDDPVIYQGIEYEIKKKNFGESLPYFVLEPLANQTHGTKAKPWVAIRGTHLGQSEGAKESVYVDALSATGLHGGPISQHDAEFKELFAELHKKHTSVQVTGHSMGGWAAQEIAARYCNENDLVIALSPPSASHEAGQLFEQKKKDNHAPVCLTACRKDDVVPKAGKEPHLGDVYQYDPGKSKDKGAFFNHLTANEFSSGPVLFQKVSKKEYADQSSFFGSRKISNVIRRAGGWLIKQKIKAHKLPRWHHNANSSVTLSEPDAGGKADLSSTTSLATHSKSHLTDLSPPAPVIASGQRCVFADLILKNPELFLQEFRDQNAQHYAIDYVTKVVCLENQEYQYTITENNGIPSIKVKVGSDEYQFSFKQMQDAQKKTVYLLEACTMKQTAQPQEKSITDSKAMAEFLNKFVHRPLRKGSHVIDSTCLQAPSSPSLKQ